jgi:hypothetical protein
MEELPGSTTNGAQFVEIAEATNGTEPTRWRACWPGCRPMMVARLSSVDASMKPNDIRYKEGAGTRAAPGRWAGQREEEDPGWLDTRRGLAGRAPIRRAQRPWMELQLGVR